MKNARILVVDDDPDNVELLEAVLDREGYTNVVGTTRSQEVVDLCASTEPDLVLLDLHMPAPDGFEVLEALRPAKRGPAQLPVIVLTADTTREAKRRALKAGARDYLGKPFDTAEVALRVANALETRRLGLELARNNELLEERVRERTAELEEARLEVLSRLALAAEFRDDDTNEHAQRVGRTAGRIAARLGLPVDEIELIELAAPLHDIGKIAVPDRVLLKPGDLDAAEFELVKRHVHVGGIILGRGRSALMKLAEEIARTHHERWEGDGYLAGLNGDAIPLSGRIVAVADVFDALTHDRPYKAAWDVPRAVDEIARLGGHQFDPSVVEAFMGLDHRALIAPVATAPPAP